MPPSSLRLGILFALVLGSIPIAAQAQDPTVPPTSEPVPALTRANDTLVRALLEEKGHAGKESRRAATSLLYLAASQAANPQSAFYGDLTLISAMERCCTVLEKTQRPDGYFDSDSNWRSAPDSGFIIVPVCKAYRFLKRADAAQTRPVRTRLERVIRLCGQALLVGGVHTPNHRWGICDGLARINDLFSNPAYVKRIDAWLAEGFDLDPEGQWAERSPHYSGDVDDAAILDMALVLGRPELLEAVRRNLQATVYLTDPDGSLETLASRKPDQRYDSGPKRALDHPQLWEYELPYRIFAIRDHNPQFAAMALFAEKRFGPEVATSDHPLNTPLASLLEWPEFAAAMPAPSSLPTDYAQVFPRAGLARIRRGATVATVFGGSDLKLGLGAGPGLSSNPTFFKFKKGQAELKSIRLTPGFFDTGFFSADGLIVEDGVYHLKQTVNVAYYQPLAPADRRSDGTYPIESNGRFSSGIGFSKRDTEMLSLTTAVAISERSGTFELSFNVGGEPGVPVTIELTFGANGTLSGPNLASLAAKAGHKAAAVPADSFMLREGAGRFQAGDDVIEFGPGTYAGPPGTMEGESVAWTNGNLRIDGQHVYLTGVTPFRHTLTVR